jgi:hypothetical protein
VIRITKAPEGLRRGMQEGKHNDLILHSLLNSCKLRANSLVSAETSWLLLSEQWEYGDYRQHTVCGLNCAASWKTFKRCFNNILAL